MASDSERCAHPTRVNQCTLVRGDIGYHGVKGLEVALDAGDEYDPLVPNG